MEENQQITPPAPSTPKSQNIAMAVLAYLSILVIIPLVSEAKNDPFVKFHIKQGLVLLIAEVALWVLMSLLSLVQLWFLTIFLYPLASLVLLVLAIIGIVNVVNGKTTELPIIGSFASNFKF